MLKILLFPEESLLSGKHRPGKETLNAEQKKKDIFYVMAN